ncbi:MAG: NAD(P)H-dependent oxidoreductase, partial [Chloroflexi bacterium]|nr:NAD(P)H-dependent oxidoreductase [Chloroflexota bacterium]
MNSAIETSGIKVLGISGSLRKGSYNTALLRAAQQLVPEGVEIEIFDLKGIPLYDGDLEADGDPESVVELKDRIRQSDAVLFVTPEYNHGISGVLKNAIDWASRAESKDEGMLSVYRGKTAAIMSASPGGFGGARGLVQVRSILSNIKVTVLDDEVTIPKAFKAFDDVGQLT